MISKRNYRTLGESDILVSPIGLGSVKFGRNTGVKYPEAFAIPDDDDLKTLLDLARELGINYLDTAPAYADSETKLGKLLAHSRDYWCISTKVGEYYQSGRSHYDFSAAATQTSIEASLKNLRTDVLDLVFVHSDGDDERVITQTDVLESLQNLKDKGLIKLIGYSGKSETECLLAMNYVDIFMITLNEQDQSQVPLIQACQQYNKGVVIKKALASGYSTDTNAALNFAVNFPGVTSVIVGTINPDHLKENVTGLVAE